MKPTIAIVAAFAAFGAGPALAQNCMMMANACGKGTRVTANFQLSAPPSASTATGDLTKTMAGLSASLYEIIDHECTVLGAALKGECRLVQVNINSNVNERMNGGPFISANGNATFEVDPKPAEESAPK